MNRDYLKQIMGEGNYETTPSGIVIPKKQKAIEKLEPEFISNNNLFGLNDKGQMDELISVLKSRGVVRVNMCYPLDEHDEVLYAKAMLMASRFKQVGLLVSMCNIDSIKKVIRVMSLKPSYLNKERSVPEVEEFCNEQGIPFMPGVEGRSRLNDRLESGYRVVKAIPYVKNNLHEIVKQNNTGMLFNAAGGINPVKLNEKGWPEEVDETFKAISELDSVIIISATQPARELLNKPEDKKALDKLDRYFELIN